MKELQLQVNEKKLLLRNIATQWSELTVQQLRCYAEVFFPYRKNLFVIEEDNVFVHPDYELLYEHIRYALLHSLLQIPEKDFLKLSAAHLHELLHTHNLVQFFFTEQWVVTKNPIQSLSSFTLRGRRTILGPSIEFHATTLEEFIVADRCYLDYNTTGDEEHLHNLMAVFFRPEVPASDRRDKLSSDVRQPFHADRMDDFMYIINAAPQWKKIVFFMWFESARNRMALRYKECFTPSADSSNETQTSGILDSLLGFARNAKDYDTIKRLPVYLVMSDAQKGILSEKEAEKRLRESKGGISI